MKKTKVVISMAKCGGGSKKKDSATPKKGKGGSKKGCK